MDGLTASMELFFISGPEPRQQETARWTAVRYARLRERQGQLTRQLL